MARQERILNREFKLAGHKKYLCLLEMFSFMKPLDTLSPREKQVMAMLMYYYNKYELLPEKEKNRLLFDYETRQAIADELKVNKQVIYNLFLSLKKKKMIGDNELNTGYLFPNIDKLIITFNE
jgi:hypothetical protein